MNTKHKIPYFLAVFSNMWCITSNLTLWLLFHSIK